MTCYHFKLAMRNLYPHVLTVRTVLVDDNLTYRLCDHSLLMSCSAFPTIVEHLVDKELKRVEKVHPDSMNVLLCSDAERSTSIDPH